MPGITRADDAVGAGLAINSQTTVFANSKLVIVNGDTVTPHAPHGIHDSATLIAGSNSVFVGGIAVVNAGDLATCNDPSIGSSDVLVGD